MARSAIPTLLRHLRRPINRSNVPPPIAAIRQYVYPKEGVFQPDSPARNIPGFGPAPPMNPYQTPQQGQPPYQPQQQYQQQQPPPPQYFPQTSQYGQGGNQYPPPPPPPFPPQQNPPPQQIYVEGTGGVRRFIPAWYKLLGGTFLILLGFYQVHATLGGLIPLEPGSEEDKEELEALFEELETFKIVQQLRSETRKSDEYGGRDVSAWQEWQSYEGLDVFRRRNHFTTGPLAGTRGLAAQRCFWNEELQQLFVFVNFGPAVTGWPEVVHGGVISTICDEALGRVALRSTVERTAATASLEVKFLDKIVPGMWYLMVAGTDATKLEESKGRKRYVQGVFMCVNEATPYKDGDTLVDAHPHVIANALFVVPKGGPVRNNMIPDNF